MVDLLIADKTYSQGGIWLWSQWWHDAASHRRRRGGEVWGGSIPLPSRLEGLRERRKLPQWGLGGARAEIDLVNFW